MKWQYQLQSCPTLWDSMNYSPPGFSVHGILQARILEWVTIPFFKGTFPTQVLNLGLLHCIWASREAQKKLEQKVNPLTWRSVFILCPNVYGDIGSLSQTEPDPPGFQFSVPQPTACVTLGSNSLPALCPRLSFVKWRWIYSASPPRALHPQHTVFYRRIKWLRIHKTVSFFIVV